MVAPTGRRRHCQYYFSDAASRNLDFPGNGNAAGIVDNTPPAI
jgi:hypothetical protein